MKRYFINLKDHPGVPVAFMMTALLLAAGVSRKDVSILVGLCIGLAPSALIWAIVLVTNYTNNRGK
jgi:nucleoside phosphorylase